MDDLHVNKPRRETNGVRAAGFYSSCCGFDPVCRHVPAAEHVSFGFRRCVSSDVIHVNGGGSYL